MRLYKRSTVSPEDAIKYCANKISNEADWAWKKALKSTDNKEKLQYLIRQEILLEVETILRKTLLPIDHCKSCGQWMGGPLICCEDYGEAVSEIEAIEIRRSRRSKSHDQT